MTALRAASTDEGSRAAAALSSMAAVLRAASVGAISGAIAGIVTGGIGGRVAMRITAITAGDADQGAITDAGEVVGVISLDGTLGLIIFVGIFAGLFGGLVFAGMRPWLASLGAWKGLAFGVVLLGSLGWTVIERDNFDFHTFGYATLNIAMFAAIFIAFGVLVAPLFDFFERVLPDVAFSIAGIAGIAARAFGLLALPPSLAIAIAGTSEGSRAVGLVSVYLLLAFPVVAWAISRRVGPFGTLRDLSGTQFARSIAIVVLLTPLFIGGVLDVRAITHILGEA